MIKNDDFKVLSKQEIKERMKNDESFREEFRRTERRVIAEFLKTKANAILAFNFEKEEDHSYKYKH